jgi:hypothetical protein
MAPPLITWTLDGGECSALCSCSFTLGETVLGWEGLRARLDAVENRKPVFPAGNLSPSSQWPSRYNDGAIVAS